jgi:hypothetical protein
MGSGGPGAPVMSREEADRLLARLHAEQEAVETSLLALQDHAGRRLLEGAELDGVTARRWARTEEAVGRLWACFDRFSRVLAAARDVRARRRWPSREDLTELTALLRGPVPGAGPEDDGGDDAALPPAELVTRMNRWYAEALDVVAAADAVWSALPARIDLLGEELRRLRSLARSVGVRPGEHEAGDVLERTAAELAALRAEVVRDPLAFWTPDGGSSAPGGGRPDTGRYDRAARTLEDVRRELGAVLDVRQDAEERLVRLRDVLSRADRTLAEARTARGEVLARIAASEVPAVSGPATALQEELARAAEHRRHGRWHRLSPLLDSLEERAEEELQRARASLAAVTAPLAVRAELRGRLDACKASVARQGLASDPILAQRYDAARRLLWSGPCDLRAARAAVLRYQEAAREVLPERAAGPAAADTRGEAEA